MKIGMILDNEFTGDMRVENEVHSLRLAGFEVIVLCFNHGTKANEEDFYGAKIIRIPISVFRKNKMKGLTNTWLDLYSSFWSKKIVSLVQQNNIDVVHVHDLYLMKSALLAKARLRQSIKIVLDLHENYPAALKSYHFSTTFPGKYIISIPRWEKAEVSWSGQADRIITVIEESKRRYTMLGLDPSKISVVANYVHPKLFESEGKVRVPSLANKFVISYAGTFDAHRGLEVAIRSIPFLTKDIPNLLLLLIGTGRNENQLIELANSLGVSEYVRFEGKQPPNTMPGYIEVSHICLIPHLKTEHTDNTIPHKLFQYMYMKKAVVSSNCDPIERILKESGAGMVYDFDSEKMLAERILYLYKNPEERIRMGNSGAAAVNTKYNWEEAAKNLIQVYEDLNKEISMS